MTHEATPWRVLEYLAPMYGPGPAATAELRRREVAGLAACAPCDGWGSRCKGGERIACGCGGTGSAAPVTQRYPA